MRNICKKTKFPNQFHTQRINNIINKYHNQVKMETVDKKGEAAFLITDIKCI